MPKPVRLLVAGGGTGGHLFPALAVTQALEERLPLKTLFVGTARGLEATLIPQRGYDLELLSVSGLYRVGALKKLLGLAKLPLAFLQSARILRRFQPQVVLGVGGYAAGPMLATALALGYPVCLQEQNAFPGMTNRLLGKYAPLSFVPFAGLEGTFKNPVVVGNPIRKELLQARGQAGQRPASPFPLSVLGGSQGAAVLNQAVIGMLPLLQGQPIRILHQAGTANLEAVQSAFAQFPGVQAEVLGFINNMAQLYQESHLVLSRSGSIVNEIMALGRASILVPIPFSSGDHQRQNAIKMQQAGASILLEQADLTPQLLWQQVQGLMQNPGQLQAMEAAASHLFAGDAAALIADKMIEFFRLDQA